jgi:signal transduction histidine kinase
MILQRFDILAEFNDAQLEEVAKLCREESHGNGVKLFEEGDSAEKLYLVLEGKLLLEKKVQLGRSGSSRKATVSIQGPGQAVGWSSLVAPHNYTMSGVCIEPARLLAIDGDDMRRLMVRDPEIGRKLMNAISMLVKGRMEATTNMLTYFLSIISHELKSPMAAIESYLEVMLGGFVGEFTDKQLRMLERSALRLKDLRGLINNILDLARMQPENIQADFEWLDPAEIGAEAIEDVQLAAKEKDIKIKVNAPPGLPKIVGARRRLRQVFSNLLSNAIKFSPAGSEVTVCVRDEPEGLVTEVLDQGPGIPASEQEQIFKDFFRGRNVGEAGGTGLGLSIVKKIVIAHQGNIWLESPYEPGKPGTKFIVVIPKNLATPAMKYEEWEAQ